VLLDTRVGGARQDYNCEAAAPVEIWPVGGLVRKRTICYARRITRGNRVPRQSYSKFSADVWHRRSGEGPRWVALKLCLGKADKGEDAKVAVVATVTRLGAAIAK
jgi:hypothetical protein